MRMINQSPSYHSQIFNSDLPLAASRNLITLLYVLKLLRFLFYLSDLVSLGFGKGPHADLIFQDSIENKYKQVCRFLHFDLALFVLIKQCFWTASDISIVRVFPWFKSLCDIIYKLVWSLCYCDASIGCSLPPLLSKSTLPIWVRVFGIRDIIYHNIIGTAHKYFIISSTIYLILTTFLLLHSIQPEISPFLFETSYIESEAWY